MRLGAITLVSRNWNYNLGALLIPYALQRILEKFRVDVSLIDFTPSANKLSRQAIVTLKHKGISYLLTRAIKRSLTYLDNKFNAKMELEVQRKEKILQFKNSQLNFTKESFGSYRRLLDHDFKFDAYIVASDIVWNPRKPKPDLEAYLLGFVKNGKKISYASSVGERIPKDLHPIYKEHLSTFDHLSVREKSSAKYLAECLNFEPKVVLDPTLLLTREEWEKLCKEPKNPPEKPYILVYDLYRSNEIVPRVLNIARKLELEVICYNYRTGEKYKLPNFYTSDPFEFCWYIKNAEYVVTTSFHGTALSVLFEIPFYSIDPNIWSCRITDFLEMISLEDRFVRDPASIDYLSFESIDFSEAKEKIEEKREESVHFLRNALGV
uniref:Polysaccharide pyruvyl transferase family protein n=1 Tax=candidate division WOR-3 bacterium TaxID=2052148 RepID=A0A7C2K4A4_UNCW3